MASEIAANTSGMRIGEFSRRVGVAPETLRAWERRYTLMSPSRTRGGTRVYSADDELRVRAMSRLRGDGVAAPEAARLARADPQPRERAGHDAVAAGSAASPRADAVLAGRVSPIGEGVGAVAPAPPPRPAIEACVARLIEAICEFDEVAANLELDRALTRFEFDEVLEHVVLGSLTSLGWGWSQGTVTVAQEHFASNLIRGRLLGLSRDWGSGAGPQAILACPPGERHDLGLIVFGLALRRQGWRIAYLGADTPIFTVGEAVEALDPATVVIASVAGRRLRTVAGPITDLARRCRVLLAGAGANRSLAARVGAEALEGEPTYAARRFAALATS